MGGAPALPTPSTPGYGTFTDKNTGRKFTACYCLAQWLTAAQNLGIARGLIHVGLDIVQLTGGAAASGGTHTQGGVFDVRQYSDPWLRLLREMGSAFWPRDTAEWVGNFHGHGVIDCAHNDPAAYQFTAYWRGYSGLGQAKTGTYAGMWGYGSKDPDPWRPSVRRTWREGIAWAEAQTKAATKPAPQPAAPAPVPVPEEDELMALTIKNPLTGERWAAEDAFWSIWTYAYQASVDAKAALAVAKAAAAKGEPLTADETEAIVKEAMTDAVIDVRIGYPQPDTTTPEA